jgi:hypothetical protein
VLRLGAPIQRVVVTFIAFLIAGCGSTPVPGAMQPTPTLDPQDQQLLAELKAVDFQLYETPVTIGGYVFGGAGLNYDRNTLQLTFGGLAIDEWKAVAFNPEGGKCSTADPRYSWNCAVLAQSPGGHVLYASPSGGLPGYPPDLGDVYLELGSTVVHLQRAAGHTPTLSDLQMFADGLEYVTPERAVLLNQKARDYAQSLQKTAAARIDFKTYLPQKTIQDFTLDRKGLGNPTDPLHPYLYLHFGRVAKANEAFEFTVDEFRDSVPLSSSHCGVASPELNAPYDRCILWFTTPAGIGVYSSYETTRFDRGPTRIVVWLSMQIDKITQDEMSQFIESFAEVPSDKIN